MADENRDILQGLRGLPPVDSLLGVLSERFAQAGPEEIPRGLLLAWIREVLEESRSRIRSAAASGEETRRLPNGREAWTAAITAAVEERARERSRQTLRRVVNATGVLLHTNLGRAPLAASAQAAFSEVAAGYSNLEMDLEAGRRRSRLLPIRRLLPLITGAEAGVAVHNNAAAVYLALTALAAGREVVVSRGHLVEIGGSFRLPEIMAASGARLVEVGSTNRTRPSDYARALGAETALVLLVHPSNFRMIGFTEEAPPAEVTALAHDHGVPLLYDVGSGALRQHGDLVADEPRVQDALDAGADLVSFSGDKLLGGPQAGIVVGSSRWVERISSHPVARVVRLDKGALAALEATLELYLDPASVRSKIPLLALLSRGEQELEDLATRAAAALAGAIDPAWSCEIVATRSEVGGGSLPGLSLPSRALLLRNPQWTADAIARAFRSADPPVVGRIEKDRFLLDVRTFLEGEDALLARAARALGKAQGDGS